MSKKTIKYKTEKETNKRNRDRGKGGERVEEISALQTDWK